MTDHAYEQALKKAKADLIHAIKERDRWNLEVARLDQLVKALSAEIETEPNFDGMEKALQTGVSFNDLVSSIVNSHASTISPLFVRDQLQFHCYDLTRYSNPMAMIHQSLKRLADQGRIRAMEDGTYKRTAWYDVLGKPEPVSKLAMPDRLNKRGKK